MIKSIRFIVFPLLSNFLIADSLPYGDKPHVIPGKIEAEDFDRGKPGVAYHDIDEKNHGANYRGPTQVDIEARPDASNGHGIGWTRPGEWLNYSVEIKESGQYQMIIPVASNKQGGIFHLQIGAKDISGPIKIPDTGGWQILKTLTVKNVDLPQGRHIIRVIMDQQGPSGSIGDIDFFNFIKQDDQSNQE